MKATTRGRWNSVPPRSEDGTEWAVAQGPMREVAIHSFPSLHWLALSMETLTPVNSQASHTCFRRGIFWRLPGMKSFVAKVKAKCEIHVAQAWGKPLSVWSESKATWTVCCRHSGHQWWGWKMGSPGFRDICDAEWEKLQPTSCERGFCGGWSLLAKQSPVESEDL